MSLFDCNKPLQVAHRALILRLVSVLLLFPFASSYIPALPSNESSAVPSPDGSGLSSDANWIIQLNWQPMGVFSDGVDLQARSDNSSEWIHQGVLLHFSEANSSTQSPVHVPWIAMINCDSNSTNLPGRDNIFALARDHGARAALIYSLRSKTCRVNREFLDQFEQPLDVFSTGSLQGSRLIESQFSNVLGSGYWYQADLLNSSASGILHQISSLGFDLNSRPDPRSSSPNLVGAASIDAPVPRSTRRLFRRAATVLANSAVHLLSPLAPPKLGLRARSWTFHSTSQSSRLLPRGPPLSRDNSRPFNLNVVPPKGASPSSHPPTTSGNSPPIYLIATLANSLTVPPSDQQVPGGSNISSNQGRGGSSSTSLAMIVLYSITGFVTLMFLIVIISGAIRAVRNPERYGPRPGGMSHNPETGEEDATLALPQTRAAGLTKAILDTFPVVKFGRSQNEAGRVSALGPQLGTNGTDEKASSQDEDCIMMAQIDKPDSILRSLENKGESGPQGNNCTDVRSIDSSRRQASSTDMSRDSAEECAVVQASPVSTPPGPSMADDLTQAPHQVSGDVSQRPATGEDNPGGLSCLGTKAPASQLNMESPGLSTHPSQQPVGPCASSHHLPDTQAQERRVEGTAHQDHASLCPICVGEFEDGDDLRVLPCDARHQFHKECVDPWLLNESRFCPLCRWDLSVRKDGTKILADPSLESESPDHAGVGSDHSTPLINRLDRQQPGTSQPCTSAREPSRSMTSSSLPQPGQSHGDHHSVGASLEAETNRHRSFHRPRRHDSEEDVEREGRNRFMKYIAQVRKHRNRESWRR